MNNKKLIRMIQNAIAGETAAFLAYSGHCRSLREDNEAREGIVGIMSDELDHINTLTGWLDRFGAKKPKIRIMLFKWIGYLAGFLCFCVPESWSATGAKILETIGEESYYKMADLADELGYEDMAEELTMMAEVEDLHAQYFDQLTEITEAA